MYLLFWPSSCSHLTNLLEMKNSAGCLLKTKRLNFSSPKNFVKSNQVKITTWYHKNLRSCASLHQSFFYWIIHIRIRNHFGQPEEGKAKFSNKNKPKVLCLLTKYHLIKGKEGMPDDICIKIRKSLSKLTPNMDLLFGKLWNYQQIT